MAQQEEFRFKAATGFGAVVEGSVTAASATQVGRDLVSQGLIPVRIWPAAPAIGRRGPVRLLQNWFRKTRASRREPA